MFLAALAGSALGHGTRAWSTVSGTRLWDPFRESVEYTTLTTLMNFLGNTYFTALLKMKKKEHAAEPTPGNRG